MGILVASNAESARMPIDRHSIGTIKRQPWKASRLQANG